MKVITLVVVLHITANLLTIVNCCNIWKTGPRIRQKRLRQKYDFIIVGAGSAGSVLASRLSEDPKVQVLLLEAGGREDLRNDIPMLYSTLIATGNIWRFLTEPQNASCLGLRNRQSFWPRGKGLGGSSSINAMVFVRGNRRDYDQWASLGNYGWSYEEVLPYFRKSETVISPWLAGDTYYHGTSGPITVSPAAFQSLSGTAFLQGAFENGYPTRDIHGAIHAGSMPMMFSIRDGRRCSASKGYLWPANKRPNLHIMIHSHVNKILIDGQKKAYGVVFRHFGRNRHVYATKEVIISCGAIKTPQLLMLSGIGPRAELERHGIPVIADLPGVGENLQDHIAPGGLFWTVKQPVTLSLATIASPTNLPNNLVDYALFGRGVLGSSSGIEAVAYVKTRYANQSDDWPDIQVQFISATQLIDRGITSRTLSGFSDETWNKYYRPVHATNTMHVLSFILRPSSVGTIRLRSTNPMEQPIIDPNYLSDENDVRVMVDGKTAITAIKISRSILNSTLFREFGTEFNKQVVPGCEHVPLYSDSYWECLVRHLTVTLDHSCGTAKMGVKEDPMAVVSPELFVYGVDGLRVIDTSIMPVIPSSNTNAPTIMVGERGADLIKRKWNLKMD